ncbi:hypothetical protein CDAR_25051 [Caerostris darwini]|uniref:Uncharacterized protein n=1 Tax=Caerostris darwini TaxID=1538125 RepID=A0AAV4RJ74_9ARAC|nr:hypothetical protein CDAR_25051 [Caerostris darwini]
MQNSDPDFEELGWPHQTHCQPGVQAVAESAQLSRPAPRHHVCGSERRIGEESVQPDASVHPTAFPQHHHPRLHPAVPEGEQESVLRPLLHRLLRGQDPLRAQPGRQDPEVQQPAVPDIQKMRRLRAVHLAAQTQLPAPPPLLLPHGLGFPRAAQDHAAPEDAEAAGPHSLRPEGLPEILQQGQDPREPAVGHDPVLSRRQEFHSETEHHPEIPLRQQHQSDARRHDRDIQAARPQARGSGFQLLFPTGVVGRILSQPAPPQGCESDSSFKDH